MKELAKKWAAAGHIVFPLRGKRPLIKWKDNANCHTDYNAEDWAVRCDKLTVIDHDSGKKEYSTGWLPEHKGYTQKTKNGRHEIYAYNAKVKRTSNPCGSTGIDIKTGSGSYIKIYGEPPVELSQLPRTLEVLLNEKTASVQNMLRKLSPDTDRVAWLPRVTAIRSLLEEDGLEVAYAWSRASAGNNHEGHETYADFAARYRGLATWDKHSSLRILGGDAPPTWGLEDYSKVETGDAEWILEEFLPKGEITTLTGEPGVGKTRAALYMAVMNALKKDMPCFGGAQAKTGGKILFWGPENDDRTVTAPIIKYMGAEKLVQRVTGDGFNLGDDRCKAALYSWMRSKLFDIVIIDPLYDFARRVDNDNSLVGITECMEQLNSVAQETGVSVIGIMHTPKGAKARDINDRTHGSQGWAAKPRMRLLMQQSNGQFTHDSVENPKDISIIIKQKNSKGRVSDGLAFIVEPKVDANQPHLSKTIGVSRCVATIEGRPSEIEERYLRPIPESEDGMAIWDDIKEKILTHNDREDIEVNGRRLKGMFACVERSVIMRYMVAVTNGKWKPDSRLRHEGPTYGIHKVTTEKGTYVGIKLEGE